MTLAPPSSAAEPVAEAFAPPVDDAPRAADPTLLDASLGVKDAAAELSSRVIDTVSLAQRTLRNAARDNPYLLLGSAFGGGFVAGGGLASPLTRALVGVGLRTAGAFLIDAAVQTFAPPPPASGSAVPSDPHAPPTSPPSATTEHAHAGDVHSVHSSARPSEDLRRETSPRDPSFIPHV